MPFEDVSKYSARWFSKRQHNDPGGAGMGGTAIDPDAWDNVWYYPRLLMFNRLDPTIFRNLVPEGLGGISGGPQYYDILATLTAHKNPSSQVPHAPFANLYAPFRLGRPFIFQGQFTFARGDTAQRSEMGINNFMEWYENAPGGPFGPFGVDFLNEVYSDPNDVARALQAKMQAVAVGWVKVTYLDPRRGSDLFGFRVETEHQHKFVKSGTNACPETLGLVNDASLGTYMYVRTGKRVLHEREFIIWDAGQGGWGGSPMMYHRVTGAGGVGGPLDPCWFSLVDCNFEGLGGLADVNPYRTPIVPYDTAGWKESGGANKLVLYGWNNLSDLENDWLNTTKFIEGYNKWTFWHDAGTTFPNSRWGVLQTLGRCWGTDHAYQMTKMGYQVNGAGGPFPCRYLTANLWKWPFYVNNGTDPWSTADFPAGKWRYWMLLIVNRANPTGRLAIGGPVWLDAGWHPWSAPYRVWSHGYLDRSGQLVNEWGDTIPQPRPGVRRCKMDWPEPYYLDGMDKEILTAGLQRLRDGAWPRYPQLHGMRTLRKGIHGRGRPVMLIDPLVDWSGQRTTKKKANDNVTPDPHGDFDSFLGPAPHKAPRERPEWVQTGVPTYGAADPEFESSLYARGTIFGYAEIEEPQESMNDRWNTSITVTEVPEEE